MFFGPVNSRDPRWRPMNGWYISWSNICLLTRKVALNIQTHPVFTTLRIYYTSFLFLLKSALIVSVITKVECLGVCSPANVVCTRSRI